MAHWAEIDKNNKVIRVVVGSNEQPDEGYEWLINNLGGTWIKTSYNSYGGVHYTDELDKNGNRIPSGKSHLRFNYASIDYLYDSILDAFIPPKPTEGNWVLNKNTCLWEEITSEK